MASGSAHSRPARSSNAENIWMGSSTGIPQSSRIAHLDEARPIGGVSRLFGSQTPAQRVLRFTRTPSCKKAFDADVLVQIGPVNTFTFADKAPMSAFGLAATREARVPCERNGDRATIDKFDH